MSQYETPVWVVDDDPDDQLFIRSAFEQLRPPVRVTTLDDGEELLLRIQQTAALPHLILLDLNMPRLNGFETLARLRQLPAYKDLPVVVLTTSSAQEEREKAMAAGADAFFTKPVTYASILKLADEIVRQWPVTLSGA